MPVVVTADSVSKRFQTYQNRANTLKDSVFQRFKGRHQPKKSFWALRDVTFHVNKGQTIGIIGHNGAGKSTLLRLLCGIGRPTTGVIRRVGQVNGLLDLGTGFHPLMTGRENIRTAGILNGLTRRQVETLEQEMIEFAELEDFIDEPVRTYSSGMSLRLAFASAIHLNPEVLLIDEVLTVGDDNFRQKCINRLDQFRRDDKTLIVVSHDLDQIQNMCDEVLVLEEGVLVCRADPGTAIIHYHELMRRRTEKRVAQSSGKPLVEQPLEGSRTGSQEVFIQEVSFYDTERNSVQVLSAETGFSIEITTGWEVPVTDFGMMFGIFTEKEIKCFEIRVPSVRSLIGPFVRPPVVKCRLPALPLLPGRYYVNIGLFPLEWEFTYDYHWQMHSFHVSGTFQNASGIVSIRPIWSGGRN